MKTQLAAVCAVLSTSLAAAQDAGAVDARSAVEAWQEDPTTIFEASEVDIDEFRWIARPLVVFANTPADPDFARQVELIEERIDELVRRDVVVVVDADPAAESELRLRLRPRSFMIVAMSKEGQVMLRKPSPWDVREITRAIDKTQER